MNEGERLKLMRLCNIENDKTKESRILLKLHNNHYYPYCNL